MNFGGGMRRFLASATGNGAASPPPGSDVPLKPGAPTWPPEPSTTGPSSPPSTSPLLLRKDMKQDDPDSPKSPARTQKPLNGLPTSPRSTSGSPSRQLPSSLSRVPTQPTRLSTSRTAIQPPANSRDELLLSLLASEAVVDSRDFEILTSEEVEDLKKEQETLVSRQTAMSKKLTLDTKMRDAASSLSRVNASRQNGSKQSEEKLEVANKRVEATERELVRINDRANEITRRLLEHRAGVLSHSVRTMERKMAPDNNNDSGYNTPSGALRSPTGSSGSASVSQKPRFEGAHFFAGHAETLVPSNKAPTAAAAMELEEKLAKATEALAASSAKQAELARELAAARAEKDASETARVEEAARARETIAALELEGVDGEAHAREKEAWEDERAEWEQERANLEEQRLEDLARLQEETERLRGVDANALTRAQDELEDGATALRELVRTYNIPLYARDPSIPVFVSTLASHLQGLASKVESLTAAQAEWETLRRKLEDDVRAGFDKREVLSREVEDARREREEARKEARAIELRVKTDIRPSLSPMPSPRDFSGDKQLLAILQPVWAILPSPETRAAKFGNQRFRAGSGSSSPISPNPNGPPTSLSDLDVRSLKTLYDPRTPSSPSPNGTSAFTLDAFVQRVQALVNDDRALIERLVRFAQAHDLLKKNAERAQKLALESGTALEVYQKQVAILEERNMDLATRVSALQDEVSNLKTSIERVRNEKINLETAAAAQAATCAQLTEANNALSAKTLALAEEAASAPEALRKQLEEAKAALATAQEDVEAMRSAEQGQSMALLEELNSLQEENSKLRDQMRSMKK
ncbi:Up-regulated during septation-domain-containing protein [Mycena amicta]|nr:Up-regulated during septation-domain-containing protein [Mycena amicta]